MGGDGVAYPGGVGDSPERNQRSRNYFIFQLPDSEEVDGLLSSLTSCPLKLRVPPSRALEPHEYPDPRSVLISENNLASLAQLLVEVFTRDHVKHSRLFNSVTAHSKDL